MMIYRVIQRSITVRPALAHAARTLLSTTVMCGIVHAQPAPPKYRFDVASIRPSKAADLTNRLGPTPQGGLRGENVTLTQLIALGYGVRPFLIVDAPGWASAERFDVVATPDSPEEPGPGATVVTREVFRDRVRQRLQMLLAERFGLVVRPEMRPVPVYKLVVARGGHKMAPANPDDARRMESNPRLLRGTGVDLKTVADALAGILLRPVLDETNLSGNFNLEMHFADTRLEAPAEAVSGGAGDSTAPTIFGAINERLGLRLESARAPAPVFVVEKAHRPSEN